MIDKDKQVKECSTPDYIYCKNSINKDIKEGKHYKILEYIGTDKVKVLDDCNDETVVKREYFVKDKEVIYSEKIGSKSYLQIRTFEKK